MSLAFLPPLTYPVCLLSIHEPSEEIWGLLTRSKTYFPAKVDDKYDTEIRCSPLFFLCPMQGKYIFFFKKAHFHKTEKSNNVL